MGVELSERSRCVCFMFEESTLSSDAINALRTSGLRDSHISVTDLGILPLYSSLLFDKENRCQDMCIYYVDVCKETNSS